MAMGFWDRFSRKTGLVQWAEEPYLCHSIDGWRLGAVEEVVIIVSCYDPRDKVRIRTHFPSSQEERLSCKLPSGREKAATWLIIWIGWNIPQLLWDTYYRLVHYSTCGTGYPGNRGILPPRYSWTWNCRIVDSTHLVQFRSDCCRKN